MSLIVTLATIPGRIGNLRPCLDSILAQTIKPDRILLWYPEKFRRFKERTPIPGYLSEYPVEIFDLEDQVALNKLIGALLHVDDPEASIVSIDDDMLYPPHFLENLLRWSEKYPHAAIGHKGKILMNRKNPNYDQIYFIFGTIKTPCQVDVMDAAFGLLYKPRFFTEKALHPE
ncbi:MAG: glycosyltransferase family 2 protein, partial [Chlamydiia bacterium]|nr:glycosyltransferase family 2 protein [Chlamydiia bacterium]